MNGTLTAEAVRRRYLTLVAMRWLPTGLLIPVSILLPAERGLSLSEIGLAAAGQGLFVLFLELPTGGLADSLGRKRVLISSSLVGMASVVIYLAADSFGAFFVAFALQGVFRALDSGPLEAWDVDTVLVDGRVLMEGRRVRSVNEARVLAAAEREGERMVERSGVAPFMGLPDRFWGHSRY